MGEMLRGPGSEEMAAWEWADNKAWSRFSDADSDALEIAHASGRGALALYVGPKNTEYTVDFASMQQTNVATGYQRAVRRSGGAALASSDAKPSGKHNQVHPVR